MLAHHRTVLNSFALYSRDWRLQLIVSHVQTYFFSFFKIRVFVLTRTMSRMSYNATQLKPSAKREKNERHNGTNWIWNSWAFRTQCGCTHRHLREATSTLNGLNIAMMKHACAIVKRVHICVLMLVYRICDANIVGICAPKTVETNYEWDFKFTGVLAAHQPLPHSNNNNNY